MNSKTKKKIWKEIQKYSQIHLTGMCWKKQKKQKTKKKKVKGSRAKNFLKVQQEKDVPKLVFCNKKDIRNSRHNELHWLRATYIESIIEDWIKYDKWRKAQSSGKKTELRRNWQLVITTSASTVTWNGAYCYWPRLTSVRTVHFIFSAPL